MISPRFMTDVQLREHFGLSERALHRLRLTKHFPSKDFLIGKTDSRLVDRFFDWRSGLVQSSDQVADGEEFWE